MPEQKTFKTVVFGGFDKEDVLKYIDARTLEFTTAEEQLNGEVSAAQAKLSEKEGQLSEMSAACDELRSKYLELQGQIQAANTQIKSLQSELAAVRGYGAEQEKEMAILKEQNRLLSDEVEAGKAENERLHSAAEELNEAMSGVGDSARLMVSGAEAGAKNVIADAEKSAADVNGELDAFREEVAKIRSFAEDSMAVLVQRLEYIDKSAESAKLSTEGRRDLKEDIGRRCAEMISGIDEKMESFKKPFFR